MQKDQWLKSSTIMDLVCSRKEQSLHNIEIDDVITLFYMQ